MAVSDERGRAQARVASNALVRSAGEVIAKIASLAFFVTMARELGSEAFGSFMFALGLTSALVIGAGFGTDELTARAVAADRRAAPRMLSDVGSAKVVTAALLLALANAVVLVGDFSATTRAAVLLVGLGVAIEVVAKTWYSVFQGYERLALVSLSVIVQRVGTAAAGVTALLLGAGVIAASAIFALGAVAGIATAELSARRLVGPRPAPRPRRWWSLLKAGIPFGVASLLFVFLLRIDVTMLSFLSGEREVGFYAAAYRLVESPQFITWALGAAMLPWLTRAGGELGRGYELGLKVMNAVLLPISLVFVLFADPIVDLLYGPGYEAAVLPLQLLGATSALYGVQGFASTTFVARNTPGTFARIVAVVVIVNLAVNFVAIPRYGADGAAGTALLSSFVLAVACTVQIQRTIGPVRFGRSFAGPLIAAAAAVGVRLAVDLPFVPELIAVLAAYAAMLAAVERIAFPDDVTTVVRALPARLRRRRVSGAC